MSTETITSAPDQLPERRRADALTPRELALVDAVARRVAELLHDEPPRARLVDAAALAAALGVSRETVYAHAKQLGGQRVGDGPRGRLRFDLDQALEAWTSCVAGRRSPEAKQPVPAGRLGARRPRRVGSGAPLLPIRGSSAPGLTGDGER